LCEAFLHAFTGQPLPDDEDLEKDNTQMIPKEAKKMMQEMGLAIDSQDDENK
jgi:MetJ family methionine regulon transcriptional repressor